MAQDEEAGSTVGAEQLPLQGVVLCCTSVQQDARTEIAEVALQMGAVYKLDLTSEVTHLIVGNITTPKYRYVAKDRPDIKVLHPRWIDAVRHAWMDGSDVDIEAITQEHRLGTFFGLKICVTGFEDLEKRNAIQATVVQQGAVYSGDLTKQVTHLVAAAPQGEKYRHANLWKIPVVTFKWFEDSIRRGMALEASLYDPALPVDEQGQGAFRTTVQPRTSLGKRERDGQSQSVDEAGKRKLRRTASTRLHSQSQDMWQDLSAREDATEACETDQWKDESVARPSHAKRPKLEQLQVRRSNAVSMTSETETPQDGLFSGRYILMRGFPRDRASRLQQFLEPNGACVVHSEKELENASRSVYFKARYLLMPHARDGIAMEPPEVPAGTETVTEWWVERCIHYKRFLEPTEDALSRPLWNAKVPDLADVTICTTGFSGVDYRQIAEAVQLMGATHAERLLPSVSVLLCATNVVKKEKAYYASKHNISVVSIEWLWACLSAKRKVRLESYVVSLPVFESSDIIREPSTSSPTQSDMIQGSRSRPDLDREDAAPKRLSNIRKKRATPSLSLQAPTPVSAPPPRKPMPFVHEDDDDDEAPSLTTEDLPPPVTTTELPPKPSRPLQELSSNASPRKGSQHQEHADDVEKLKPSDLAEEAPPERASSTALIASPKSPHRTSVPGPQQPPPRATEELAADLAALIHRTSSRPESAGSDLPHKRKSRPLGRSASGIGNRSASSAQSEYTGSPLLQQQEVSVDAADGFNSFAKEAPLPPSTQLGYDSAESEQSRLMMEKKMKTSLQDESSGRRVASVGTVKDSSATGGEAGVGNRVRGRLRTK